jgi:hypothetical protein
MDRRKATRPDPVNAKTDARSHTEETIMSHVRRLQILMAATALGLVTLGPGTYHSAQAQIGPGTPHIPRSQKEADEQKARAAEVRQPFSGKGGLDELGQALAADEAAREARMIAPAVGPNGATTQTAPSLKPDRPGFDDKASVSNKSFEVVGPPLTPISNDTNPVAPTPPQSAGKQTFIDDNRGSVPPAESAAGETPATKPTAAAKPTTGLPSRTPTSREFGAYDALDELGEELARHIPDEVPRPTPPQPAGKQTFIEDNREFVPPIEPAGETPVAKPSAKAVIGEPSRTGFRKFDGPEGSGLDALGKQLGEAIQAEEDQRKARTVTSVTPARITLDWGLDGDTFAHGYILHMADGRYFGIMIHMAPDHKIDWMHASDDGGTLRDNEGNEIKFHEEFEIYLLDDYGTMANSVKYNGNLIFHGDYSPSEKPTITSMTDSNGTSNVTMSDGRQFHSTSQWESGLPPIIQTEVKQASASPAPDDTTKRPATNTQGAGGPKTGPDHTVTGTQTRVDSSGETGTKTNASGTGTSATQRAKADTGETGRTNASGAGGTGTATRNEKTETGSGRQATVEHEQSHQTGAQLGGEAHPIKGADGTHPIATGHDITTTTKTAELKATTRMGEMKVSRSSPISGGSQSLVGGHLDGASMLKGLGGGGMLGGLMGLAR